mgnify:CR=1 FL=1
MAGKKYPGGGALRAKLLQEWQVDYIGSLLIDRGHRYVFIGVDMAISLGFVWLVAAADQRHTVTALEHLAAACGWPSLISNDRGTHFTGQEVQIWAHTNDVQWQLHVSCCSQAAGMVERFDGLRRDKLSNLGPG